LVSLKLIRALVLVELVDQAIEQNGEVSRCQRNFPALKINDKSYEINPVSIPSRNYHCKHCPTAYNAWLPPDEETITIQLGEKI